MKNYESEFEELKEWLKKETNSFYKAFNESKPVGCDSELEHKRYEDVQKYNRRLKNLKQKYNR